MSSSNVCLDPDTASLGDLQVPPCAAHAQARKAKLQLPESTSKPNAVAETISVCSHQRLLTLQMFLSQSISSEVNQGDRNLTQHQKAQKLFSRSC